VIWLSIFLLWNPQAPGNWASWRGPNHTGSTNASIPIRFDADTNLLWQTPLQGRGHSSPIIWGGTIYLTTAVETKEPVDDSIRKNIEAKGTTWANPKVPQSKLAFELWAVALDDGHIRWRKPLLKGIPHETTHGDASWASASCVTNGQDLVTSFGSMGIFCTDLAGTPKWQVDLGDMRTRRGFGEGASPIIVGDRVILTWDHEDQSFIVALDLATGKEVWRQLRDEPTSWSTPLAVQVGGQTQILAPGHKATRAYDAANGKEIWSLGGMTLNVIPCPIYHDGMAYFMSGFRGNMLQAVRLGGAEGKLEDTEAVAWTHTTNTSYVPSALLHRDQIYFLKRNNGILTSLDAKTGEVIYGPVRLDTVQNIYASPVAAGDHIYIVGRDGSIAVVQHGSEFKQVATNRLDDRFDASPAISGNRLILRGHKALYAIGSK